MRTQLYGNIHNRLIERVVQKVPQVGMGATVSLYSDRQPYTITQVSTQFTKYITQVRQDDGSIKEMIIDYPKWIMVVEDNYKVTSGSTQDGSAQYEFSRGNGEEEKYIFHNLTGVYRKERMKTIRSEHSHLGIIYQGTNRTTQNQTAIIVGIRDKYYDPSF